MRRLGPLTALLLALLLCPAASQAGVVRYVNAVVFDRPERAFVVRDGRLVWSATGAVDSEVDLAGGFVVPWLQDAHVHVLGLGEAMDTADLRGADSPEAVVATLKHQTPETEWVRGFGWDHTRWPGRALPTHAPLTAAFPDRPVLLSRIDGHAVWLNAEAMRRLGLSASTGVLVDAAAEAARARLPAPDPALRRRWVLQALRHLRAQGLTAVHDLAVDAATLSVYGALDAAGALPIRVHVYVDDLGTPRPPPGRRLSVVGLKLTLDGALGSRGAALVAPYSDAPATRGTLRLDSTTLASRLRQAQDAGLRVALHAIGDAAVGQALDAIEAASFAPERVRLEHLQVLPPGAVARLVRLRVVASVQPSHLLSDAPWVPARLGPERTKNAYPWRTLLDAGLTLALGTDAPVEPPDVLRTLLASTTGPEWHAHERLSATEALRAMSGGALRAVGGDVALADFTVFDRDPRSASPVTARVLRVVVGGHDVQVP